MGRAIRDKTKRSNAIFRDVEEKSFTLFGILKFNDIFTRHFLIRHCLVGYWPTVHAHSKE